MAVDHKVPHPLGYQSLVKIIDLLRILLGQFLYKRIIRNLIVLFVLLVVGRIHLKTVISKVDKFALILESVWLRGCSQVKWLIYVKVLLVVDQGKDTEIKLSAFV